MPMFRKKSPPVHAVRWTGDVTTDLDRLLGDDAVVKTSASPMLLVKTYRGDALAHVGDWIVRLHGSAFDKAGVLAIIDPETFAELYESVDVREWCDGCDNA